MRDVARFTICRTVIKVTNLRRKKFRATCLGFLPFSRRPTQYQEPERAVGHIKKCLILVHYRKVETMYLNMLLQFSDLAPIQIHNHAYILVGIYSQKTRYKHK
jgi:hypothetical protein